MSEAPENVRLVIGGREYPCDVLRDPDQDDGGCAAWVVVPREALPPFGKGAYIRVGMLPPKSRLVFSLGETP